MGGLFFPARTFPAQFYKDAWEKGKRKSYDGRMIIIWRGMAFPLARVLWNFTYPHDLAQPNEEIHHQDENRHNDTVENYIKLTKQQHDLLHWKPRPTLPEETKALIQELYNKGMRGKALAEHVGISKRWLNKFIKKWRKKERKREGIKTCQVSLPGEEVMECHSC